MRMGFTHTTCRGATKGAAGTLTRIRSGTAGLGSYPTDATHEGRSRRAARSSAAILAPECLRQQSLRHYVQVESCQPPFWIGTIDIWIHWAAVKAIILSQNVLGPSYLAQFACSDLPLGRSPASPFLQRSQAGCSRPAERVQSFLGDHTVAGTARRS